MATASRALAALLLTASMSACVTDDALDKGEEEEVPTSDDKADSFRRPTEQGELTFGQPDTATLTATERHHAWTFELFGDAEVELWTGDAQPQQPEVDTVLYLYREGASGWGPYVARDDDADAPYSRLRRDLPAGRYRVLVKGYLASTRGAFAVTAACAGAGCAPTPPPSAACVFGATYADLETNPALQVYNRNVVTAATLDTLTALDRQRLVLAVQQSSHTDVTTPEEAIARVDGGELNVTWFGEPAALRGFVAMEYGAGDNSYGAIFDRYRGVPDGLVASIRDGDLYGCTLTAETCALPEELPALRADPAFALLEEQAVTTEAGLADAAHAQVLAALQRANPAVGTIADGLAWVDGGVVNRRTYLHTTTVTELVVVDFAAGDTVVGSIFYGQSLQVAAVVDDLFLGGCTLFVPVGGVAEGEACRGAGDCAAGLLCAGAFAGAGACVSTADVPGEGLACTADADCGSPDLVCAGATRGGGLCNPAWQRGAFVAPGDAAIPDGGTLTRRVAARGLATVDTDVVVRLRLDHPRASQLRVTLTNPASAEVVVFDGAAGDDGAPVVLDKPVLGFSGDESVNGEWTLRITDRAAGHVGVAGPWTLELTSRWD